jgi:hypothetical protein
MVEQDDLKRAEEFVAEGLAVARTIADFWGLAYCLRIMSMVAEERHDIGRAASLHAEAMATGAKIADEGTVAWNLEGIARVAISAGEAERAVRLLGAAEAVWEAHPAQLHWWWKAPREQARHDRAVATAQMTLGEQGFAAAFGAGEALAVPEAVAEAQALAAELGSEAW